MPISRSTRVAQRLLRFLGVLTILGLETAICTFLVHVNPTTVGFLFLATTLVVATRWSLWEAVEVSLTATVCFNFFFLPPLYTFTIADPENWVSLFTFLGASLLTSRLSEQARRRTAEAISRQRDLEQLHSLSQSILQSDSSQSLGQELAQVLASEIARIYAASSVAIYDRDAGKTFCAGPQELPEDAQRKLWDAAIYGGTFQGRDGQGMVAAFGLGGKPVGSLAVNGAAVSQAAQESLANLVAIGLEKARNQQAVTRADAARQMQEFKSMLLDALAHEFKTPLTTIKAAASSMLESGIIKPAEQHELTMMIEQEADRISALVTEATQLARIEAGEIHLEKQPCDAVALMETAVEQMETALSGRPVNVSASSGLPKVLIDRDLIQLVLRNILDNAVKYSAPNSPIRLFAETSRQFLRIIVANDLANEAQPIPASEEARLFQKYYRGTSRGSQSVGTGMGLAIAKEILSAHGGDVRLESSASKGTEVSIFLPATAEGAAS